MPPNGAFTIIADASEAGQRLDTVVAVHIVGCSRSLAANLIIRQHVLVDGRLRKPGYRVKSGDTIQGEIPAPVQVEYAPEPIPLDILYQDNQKTSILLEKKCGKNGSSKRMREGIEDQ